MRKIMPIAGILALLVALAACSPAALFELEGNYDYTLTATDSTNGDFPTGYEEDGTVVVTTDGNDVEADFGGLIATGTRSGNSVQLDAATADADYVFNLTWVGDSTFDGTGRADFTGGTYVEFEITGQEAVSITSAGSQGADGVALLGR